MAVYITPNKLKVLLSLLVLIQTAGKSICVGVNEDSPYQCVWNSPSITCDRYGFTFNLSQFDVVQNPHDSFNGENITIFYGPGTFPKIDRTTGAYTNGGIPQLGNLTYHLEQLTKDVEQAIPDKNFQGLGVLDFEQWRPLYKHNFDSLNIYKKASEDLVKKQHPSWTNSTQIEQEAERQFNMAGRQFFESTLTKVKELRPGGRWGYYGFPRCYGKHGNFCAPGSQEDNDILDWLWTASSALYPRIYLAKDTDHTDKVYFLMATVHEAVRISNKQSPGQLLVYPYSRHSYDSAPGKFFSEDDLWLSHAISSLLGGDGAVIWGSTKSMESEELCSGLHTYTTSTFGPFVKKFTEFTKKCSQEVCTDHGRCVSPEIPTKLDFLEDISDNHQKKWVDSFLWLLSTTKRTASIQTENYSCKCYPQWKGDNCKEPN